MSEVQNTEVGTVNEGAIAEAPKPKRERIRGVDQKVKVSDVLRLLEEGKDRKTIKKDLKLTAAQAKILFNHEKIKGKKMHYSKAETAAKIEIIDDVEDEDVSEETAATTATAETSASAPAQAEQVTEQVPAGASTDSPEGW